MNWEDVYNTRITPDSKLEEVNMLLKYEDIEIWAEGSLSCVVGQAKSKKTFLMSLLLEKLIKPTGKFTSDLQTDVEAIVFDTEQSDRRIQMVSKRFSRPELITFIPIRQYNIIDRYNIIEQGIKRLRPNIVVLDGIKELVLDINDGVYASKLMNKMLEWATKYKCHITSVLHLNPGSEKPRGAVGTEILNKCASVLKVETRGANSRVQPLAMRDGDFKPFYFTIDDNGTPQIK